MAIGNRPRTEPRIAGSAHNLLAATVNNATLYGTFYTTFNSTFYETLNGTINGTTQ